MIAWFARNGVAANLLMFALVGMGIHALLTRVNREIFPSIQAETVNISVPYRGSTPAEVEESIVIRVEEAIQDLPGIDRMISNANEGNASIRVEVLDGYDVRELLDDIKNRVDSINTFPAEAERPIISTPGRQDRAISVVLAADLTEPELRELGTRIRDEIANLPDVSIVELKGVRPYEIAIEISEQTLRKYGLSLAEVAQRINQSSLDLSAGRIRTRSGDVLLRTQGQAYVKEDFAAIVLRPGADGSSLRLGDIARVDDGFEENPLFTRFNGQRAVMIDVVRVGDQDAIAVTQSVRSYLEQARDRLPPGTSLTVWQDRSEMINQRLELLITNALQGGVLVLLSLTLFLRPSLALWVALGIPVSFLASLAVLPLLGVSINLISVFAYILVLGIVVDDAIVTGENVFSRMQRGENPLEASINGTREIAVPVTFGVLTTMLAFTPLLMIEGTRGQFFSNIPAVVVPVLFFSLIESKLVLPHHLSLVKSVGLGVGRESLNWLSRLQRRVADGLELFVKKVYQPQLEFALRHRYATLSVFVAIFLGFMGYMQAGHIRFVFFQFPNSDSVSARLTMPVGTPEEITARHLEKIERGADNVRQRLNERYGEGTVRNVLSTLGGHPFGGRGGGAGGGGDPALAEVVLELAPAEERNPAVDSRVTAMMWRQEVGVIPGAEDMAFNFSFNSGNAIEVQLTGPDFDALDAAAEAVKERLQYYPGVFDITDSFEAGKDELRIALKPAGEFLGISLNDVARQVRQAFFGAEAQRIQRGRDDVRVMVRFPQDERRSIIDLQRMYIRTPQGTEVPFSEVATAEMGKSLPTIRRIDRNRTISVTADADDQAADVTAIRRELDETVLPEILAAYPTVSYSLEGEAREQRQSMSGLRVGIVIVLFGIFAMLAVVFRSYSQPFIVMSAIPFGIVGAVLGHVVMGYINQPFGVPEPYALSMLSLFGMLALSGVVVNDSLVMVDFINRRRREGTPLHRAVAEAGAARFRAILLTSITTVAGLGPLLFEKSRQAQFLIPMAISLAWGVAFATFITLLLVPALYLVFEDCGNQIRRVFRWLRGGHGEITVPEREPITRAAAREARA
jgi:multidrug efflux pump subunit AcrB